MLRRPHSVAATLLAAAALLGTGCDSGNSSSDVQGSTLTVYVGLPLHGPSAPEGEAIQNGMKLALADAGGESNGREVQAVYMDDTKGERWDQATTADNARRASQDVTAIGYLGDLESGATRVSLPITNQAEMMQVSPASTAVDLTRAAAGQTPDRLQPSDKRTFARVVPADDVQARAAGAWAKDLGAKKVATINDGELFGKVTATAFEDGAREVGLKVVPPDADPDLVFVGGSGEAVVQTLRSAAGGTGSAKLIGTDAFLAPEVISRIEGLEDRLYVTSPFIDAARLPAAGKTFAGDYRRKFGAAPEPAAAYGYESMALLLDAIERAGSEGDDREAVINAVLATRDRDSILGRYSIDEFGDTTLDTITGYRVRGGKPVSETELRAPR